MPLRVITDSFRFYGGYLKKIFAVIVTIIVVITLFNSFTQYDRRQDLARSGPRPDANAVPQKTKDFYAGLKAMEKDEVNGGALNAAIMRSLLCSSTGYACTDNPADAKAGFRASAAGRAVGLLNLPLQHPPASGIYWAKGALENAGFVPKSYAQGVGFYALTPFQDFWKVSRNIAYLAIVIVVVALGFMIMFRVQAGKSAVSAEMALPKLVFALLVISFSYAIAGFLIDCMYMLCFLVVSLFGPAAFGGTFKDVDILGAIFAGRSIAPLWSVTFGAFGANEWWALANSIFDILPDVFQGLLQFVVSAVGTGAFINYSIKKSNLPTLIPDNQTGARKLINGQGQVFLDLLSKTSKTKGIADFIEKVTSAGGGGSLFGVPIGYILYALAVIVIDFALANFLVQVSSRVLVLVLIMFSMLFIFIKLLFMMVKAYINIMLSIIFAPLILMFEAVPGRDAFKNWLMGLISNLIVFPTTIALALVAKMLITISTTGDQALWAPPFLSSTANNGTLEAITAGFILFMIPDIVGLIQKQIGAKDLPINFNPMTFFAGAAIVATSATGGINRIGGLRKSISDAQGGVPSKTEAQLRNEK